MFTIAFHKQAVSAPLLNPRSGDAQLTPHQLKQTIDEAMTAAGTLPPKRIWLSEAAYCAYDPGKTVLSKGSAGNVWAVVSGCIARECMADLRELYGLPPMPEAEPCAAESARLLLELYEEGFADADGDYSDQPATVLGVLEGTMSFALYDEEMQYLLVHRCPGTSSTPLYWGPDAAGQVLLLSTQAAGHLSAFPPGCAFESRLDDGQTDGWNRLLNVTRHSPAARAVNTVPKVNSRGALCGMMFKSVSGRDLVLADAQVESDVC